MTTSPYDGFSRAPLRAALATLGCVTLVSAAVQLRAATPGSQSHPLAPAWLLSIGQHAWALALLVTSGAAGFVALALGRRSLTGGLTGVAALAVLCEAHAAVVGGPARNLFLAGAATLGWTCGLAYARLRARGGHRARALPARSSPAATSGEERFAEYGALGVVAATYAGAATSKLLASGASWLDPSNLRAVVVSQHPVSDGGLLAWYARLVSESGALSTGLSALTLVVQLSGVFLLGPPRVRVVVALGLLSFHANVLLLTRILYGEPMIFLLVFGLPWPRLLGQRPRAEPPLEVAPRPLCAGLAGALLVATLLGAALLSGVRGYTTLHHRQQPPRRAEPPASPEVTRLLGGLGVGAELAGFEVRSIRGSLEEGVALHLQRGGVELVLSVTRAGTSGHTAPRAKGPYELLYGKGAPGGGEATAAERDAALDALVRRLDVTPAQ